MIERADKKRRRAFVRVASVCALIALPTLGNTATFEPEDCPFEPPTGQIQGETLRCGFLVVPEDREDPASRSIRLAVAIFENPNETASDPIVYLSGGPGGSALEFIRFSFSRIYAPLFATGRDIVVFDQRGVGVSQPALDCPEDAFAAEHFLACADTLRSNADLSDYHTASNAADVDDLRTTLGYEQLNLWGVSYGTRLALDVMRDRPEGLRSVVLDAVYPPDVDLFVETPANVARAMQHLFDQCAAHAQCDAAYPDLAGTLESVVARMNAAPAPVQLSNPQTGDLLDVELSGNDFVLVLFQYLYATELLGVLPKMIHDAAVDNYREIERSFGAFIAQGSASSRGMQFSVFCHDEVAFSSRGLYEAAIGAYPLLKPALEPTVLGGLTYDVCDGWGAGRADELENIAVTSDMPTLLLAGDYDPVTPPSWAHLAGATLPNGRIYQFPATGHGATTSSCGRSMMVAFIEDPDAPLDASCMDGLNVAWSLPSAQASSSAERLADLRARLAVFPPSIGLARFAPDRRSRPER